MAVVYDLGCLPCCNRGVECHGCLRNRAPAVWTAEIQGIIPKDCGNNCESYNGAFELAEPLIGDGGGCYWEFPLGNNCFGNEALGLSIFYDEAADKTTIEVRTSEHFYFRKVYPGRIDCLSISGEQIPLAETYGSWCDYSNATCTITAGAMAS